MSYISHDLFRPYRSSDRQQFDEVVPSVFIVH